MQNYIGILLQSYFMLILDCYGILRNAQSVDVYRLEEVSQKILDNGL